MVNLSSNRVQLRLRFEKNQAPITGRLDGKTLFTDRMGGTGTVSNLRANLTPSDWQTETS